MKINSLDKTIRDTLGSGFFEIPRFQRPYSWDSENISDFLQDSIETNDSDYFIGSIVVYKKGESSFGVVDGQQRITTITLILAALRNLFKETGAIDLAAGVQTLIERSNINAEKVFVLRTETSFPYLQDTILRFDGPELKMQPGIEEKNLQSGYNQIYKFLKSRLDDSKSQELDSRKNLLKELRDKVLGLKIIFIELDNEEDAYVIFETLNTRGKELAASDLIKNYISRLIPPTNSHLDKVKIFWQEITETIEEAPGSVTFSNYLQHYWLSRFDYTSNNKLYYYVKKQVNKDNASDLLVDLKKCSQYYRTFYEPTYWKWDKQESQLRDSVEAIDIFNVRSPLPLMLAIMSKYGERAISKRQTEMLLASLEKFIFAYTSVATTQSTGGLSKKYSTLAIKLRLATTESEKNLICNEIKVSLRENFPLLESFVPKFKQISYSEQYTKERSLVRYILGKFYQKAHPLNPGDYRQMTIEHIMPQDQIKDKETLRTIGCLGNQILVPSKLNEELGNRPFSEKKQILEKAGYKLDPEIAESRVWTAKEIEARLVRMSTEAYQLIWKI